MKCRVALGLCLVSGAAMATVLELPNVGFEDGLAGWTCMDKGMSSVVPEAAHSGGMGLRVRDASATIGSSIRSTLVPAVEGRVYAVEFWARPIEGQGAVAVYLQFFDEGGKNLTTPKLNGEYSLAVEGEAHKWRSDVLYGRAPVGARTVGVWVHSFVGLQGTVDFDDFQVRLLGEEEGREKLQRINLRSREAFPMIDQRRQSEIAAWLTPQPQRVGQPASDRSAWEKLAALPQAANLLKEARKIARKEVPELPDELYLEFTSNGNRTRYQSPYTQRTAWLSTLMIAESLEYQGNFLPAIERMVEAICAERSWTMPAHDSSLSNFNGTQLTIDLGAIRRAWLLTDLDTFLGHAIKPELRVRMRAEIMRRVVGVYQVAVRSNSVKGNTWMRRNNNWNAVCTAGVVWSGLALLESREERAEVLAAMEISNPFFISGFTADGYCSEGMDYWNYGFGHYVMMGLAVRAVTEGKLDIFQGEKLVKVANYARGYQVEEWLSPRFADGGGNPSQEILSLMRQVWPQAVPAHMEQLPFLRGGHASIALRAFGQEPQVTVAERKPLPLHTWFENAQVLLTRGATADGKPFGAAIKGGHNAEHHNHNDVGSYTIVIDGVPIMGDPGGEVYTRRTFSKERYVSKVLNSWGHPVPCVAGELQATGRASAAEVVSTEFSDERDRLVLDISSPYQVAQLRGLRRSFTHERKSSTITIIDDVRFSAPSEFNVPLITTAEVERMADGKLVLRERGRAVEVRIDAEGGTWQLQEEAMENPGKPTPKRIAVTFDKPLTNARVRFIVSPLSN